MRVSPWLIVALLTGGCTSYESAYERAVTDYEPVYCYQSLAGVTCHRGDVPADVEIGGQALLTLSQ